MYIYYALYLNLPWIFFKPKLRSEREYKRGTKTREGERERERECERVKRFHQLCKTLVAFYNIKANHLFFDVKHKVNEEICANDGLKMIIRKWFSMNILFREMKIDAISSNKVVTRNIFENASVCKRETFSVFYNINSKRRTRIF